MRCGLLSKFFDHLYMALLSSEMTMTNQHVTHFVVFRSAKEQSTGSRSPQSNFVLIHSDGTCTWWPLFEHSVSHCVLDVTWYPFDDQRCNLSFESWKYSSRTLNITAEQLPDQNVHYKENDAWKLLGRPAPIDG